MRPLRFLPLGITLLLIWFLDTSHGILPPLGRFLDPVNGAMTAAEPTTKNFSDKIRIKGLQQEVSIDLEDRLVPHITAQNDHDLYLAQGYIHAYFRLWQMDLQTRAAAGRVCEIAGKKAFKFDQGQRRKGMVYAAERSLKAMEAEPRTKAMLDAYTAGINAFINSLSYRDLPLEYKLMNFKPEPWTNLKCALLLKYMADDLTGASDDISYTFLRDQLGQEQFDFLFPEKIKGSKPVIPEGTKFDAPSLKQPTYPGDSVWAHFGEKMQNAKVKMQNPNSKSPIPTSGESGIGSNNWAISGAHTASGKPILCNDPHLGLNLPSLWFEVQLTAPGINTYGVSLPGAPGVVIGFNDSISWGFTNNYRDVKDYYEITNTGRESYLFNGKQVAFEKRAEHIVIKDSIDVIDTVLYTLQGPVQYEPSRFPDLMKTGKMLAMCWMAHRPTNELLALYLMNRATNYETFTAGIQHFECPAQNFAYADKTGNIAMWGQGQFINKWRGQGKFVMEGKDSLTLWGQNIPMAENPHVLNPPQGYVASANQNVTDSTYPYWYNGRFVECRSWRINNEISRQFQQIPLRSTIDPHYNVTDMMALQNDVHSIIADMILPFMLQKLRQNDNASDSSLTRLRDWNKDLQFNSVAATAFQLWFDLLSQRYWKARNYEGSPLPNYERTVQIITADSSNPDLENIMTESYLAMQDSLLSYTHRSTQPEAARWANVKNTSLTHLAKLPAFSYTQLKTGGWGYTINAMKGNHGPSWRMIVEMDDHIKAYGVYPGGQSGNPGSVHYGDNIDKWVEGKYYDLHFVTPTGPKVAFKYKMVLSPA